MDTTVLILPGIGNSDPAHWQSRWEAAHPSFQRVTQRDWDHPVLSEWTDRLEQAVAAAGPDIVLVAHSLGCLTAAHWAAVTTQRIRAALLVATPDPAGPAFPREATGFAEQPIQPLPFRSRLVASSNDPYASLSHAQACAAAWGSELVLIGDAGHINAASGFGDWPQGLELLRGLLAPA